MDVISDDILWYVLGHGEYQYDPRMSLDLKRRAIASARVWPRDIVIDSADWFLSEEDRAYMDVREVTWMVFPTPPWAVVREKRQKDTRGFPLYIWSNVYMGHLQRLQCPEPGLNVRYMDGGSDNLG